MNNESRLPRLNKSGQSGARFNWSSLVAPALVVLFVAARARGLAAYCLWFDEVFGVHAARHTWGGLWRFVAADLIHPPLFYALLKIWITLGGDSLLWLRLFPFVASVASLVPFLLLARELRLGRAATNLALLLVAANGYLIKYAQDVRMYSLLMLVSLFSLWLFARLLNEGETPRRSFVALFVVNLLLVYTHYYGWLVVAGEAVFLSFAARRKLPRFLLTVAALAACFAPWVAAVAGEAGGGAGLAQNIGWIERPGWKDFTGFFALLHGPFHFRQSSDEQPFAVAGATVGFLLIALPVALLLARTPRRRADGGGDNLKDERLDDETLNDGEDLRRAVALPLFFTLFPVAVAALASYLLPHAVWGTRHLIVAAVPYLLLAGLALRRLRPAWLKAAALVTLGCWLALACALSLLRREASFVWCAWEGLILSAAREETAEAVNVYAFEDLVAYHLWFALEAGGGGRFRVSVVKGVEGIREDPAFFLPRRFDGVARADASALTGERFWLAFRDAAWDEQRPPLKILKERGYRFDKVFETSAQGQRVFLVLASRAKAG